MLSWCDKLASTPVMGFRLDNNFIPSEAILQAWSPILSKIPDGDDLRFSIDAVEPMSFGFINDDGFKYGADHSKVHVGFNHRLRAVPVSGGSPVMEMLSKPQPFTELLPIVGQKLVEATLLLPHPKERHIRRVGVIAVTSVDEADFPPGITRFVEYLGRPWGTSPDSFSVNITAELQKTESYIDRCIHQLIRPDDAKKLFTMQFDWQREFIDGRPITAESLKAIVAEANKAALAYFEDLAEGSRFDEELLAQQ